MKHKLILATIATAVLSLNSCIMQRQNSADYAGTGVQLEQANYRVLATQVKGESTGIHLFGIFPLARASYLDAVRNLYKNSGELRNRSAVIVNVRKQENGTNFILFTRPKVEVTADVVEFTR